MRIGASGSAQPEPRAEVGHDIDDSFEPLRFVVGAGVPVELDEDLARIEKRAA